MGGGGQTTTTTSKPYSTNAADAAVNTATAMFNDPASWPQYYPGQTVTPFTDAQNAALSGIIKTASAGSPLVQPTVDFARNLEGGNYLYNNPGTAALQSFTGGAYNDPMSNPAFADTLNQLTGKTLPGIVSQFVAGGNLNNPAMAYAAGQGVTDATAPYLSQLYESGLNRQLQAAQSEGSLFNQGLQSMVQGAGLAPSLQQMPYTDLQQLFNAGTTQQNQQQQQTNADIAKWNFDQNQRMNMVNWLSGIAFGAPGGTTTSMTTPYAKGAGSDLNTAGQALGMVGTLAAMY
jgi:hypothetical protein